MSDLTLANGSLSPLGSTYLSSVNPMFQGLAYGDGTNPTYSDAASLTDLLSGSGAVGGASAVGGGGNGIPGLNGAFPTATALGELIGVSPAIMGAAGSIARGAMGPLGMALGAINTVGTISNTDRNSDVLGAMGAMPTTGQQIGGYFGSNGLAGTQNQGLNALSAPQQGDIMTFGANLVAPNFADYAGGGGDQGGGYTGGGMGAGPAGGDYAGGDFSGAGGADASGAAYADGGLVEAPREGWLSRMREQVGAPPMTPEREQELHDLAVMLGLGFGAGTRAPETMGKSPFVMYPEGEEGQGYAEGGRVRSDPSLLRDDPLSPLSLIMGGGAYSEPVTAGNATAMDPEAQGALAMMRRQVGAPPQTQKQQDAQRDWASDIAGNFVTPIRAYHGSPHDFDRFDLSKIGTGEGAQAYGHGLYFAEKEGVARGYRDQIAAKQGGYSGSMNLGIDPYAPLKEQRAFLSDKYGSGNFRIKRDGEIHYKEPDGHTWLLGGYMPKPGKMYEVNIHADPASLLDWDKPLSGQSGVMSQLDRVPKGIDALKYGNPNPTGRDLYTALGSLHSDAGPITNPSRASSALREAGIPGIQYLDGGSRSAGEGSRNLVMFQPELIEILRKYGLAGLTAGGGLAAGANVASEPQP